MEEQKKEIIQFVQDQKMKSHSITATLKDIKAKRPTYYSWLRPKDNKKAKPRITELIPEEKQIIEKTKEEYPHLRHSLLQNKGLYLSYSSVYHHLKSIDMIEPYERRPSPLKDSRYNIWQRNLMWGCDWTKLLINHIRWYLLIIIDFFSRYIIAYDICPSVNASHIKHIYTTGLKNQGIRKNVDILPELRGDRGSPNTSLVTKEFFDIMGADLSFARVRRPTDNALTERFFGTAKQEEIYMVGSYTDEQSARYEIGYYIHGYNYDRPHQSLWNFTPAHVHEVNNKTEIIEELAQLKHETKLKRKLYWENEVIC
jgi:putative transposase